MEEVKITRESYDKFNDMITSQERIIIKLKDIISKDDKYVIVKDYNSIISSSYYKDDSIKKEAVFNNLECMLPKELEEYVDDKYNKWKEFSREGFQKVDDKYKGLKEDYRRLNKKWYNIFKINKLK